MWCKVQHYLWAQIEDNLSHAPLAEVLLNVKNLGNHYTAYIFPTFTENVAQICDLGQILLSVQMRKSKLYFRNTD